MKIKTMTASFGRLTGQRLALTHGFNLLEAPSEGGKSTWAAFLKAMLYGIDTRDRDRKGYLADKNRYQPWSGAPMEGELTLEWQGRDITLRRGPKGSTPFGAFSAVYTNTGEPVPGMTADVCGELLTGVGREVFERSAFLGQSGSLAITSVPELERRIAALVSSGEESVSYSQVESRLKEWLNRRKVNKSVGRIPQLEEELSRVRQQREELEQLTGALNTLSAEETELRRRKEALEEEMSLHRQRAQRELDQRLAQAKAELDLRRSELDSLRTEQSKFGPLPSQEALKRAQGDLAYLKALDEEIRQGEAALALREQELDQARAQAEDPRFPGMTGEEAAQKAQKDTAEYQQHLTLGRAGLRRFPRLQLLGAAAFALLAVAELFRSGGLGPLFWAGAGLLLAFTAWGLFSLSAGKRELAAGAQVLERWGAASPEEITLLAQQYQERMDALDQAAQQVRLVREGLADRQARRDNSRRDLFGFVHAFAPEVTDLFGCSAALSRALGLGEREAVAAAKLEGAQRLYDTLLSQGGQELSPSSSELPAPGRTMEETAALLGTAQAELERTSRALNMALGRQKAAGDPAALAARQEELEEELARRSLEYRSISAALDALKEANARLQERFSPELNRRAGEYLAQLTSARYTALSLDRGLEASAASPEDVLPRRSLFLSKGTVDQIYLAVRLAVYDLCLEGHQVPLVLDDALGAFDDTRMGLALDLLLELSQTEQILFFTCHRRERDYLAGRPGVSVQKLP